MTIHLFARGNRATSITTLAVLGVMAFLIAPSTPARAADGRPTPVLAQGVGMGAHPSAKVRVVQRALDDRGYDLGAPGVDGRFGPLTAAAVRRMQTDYGLAVDGIVGNHTLKALRVDLAPARTRSRSHREHGTTATRKVTSKSPQRSAARSVASPSQPGNVTVELGYSGNNWFGAVLAGMLGGLITLVVAMGVGVVRRGRQRDRSSGRLPDTARGAMTAHPASGEREPHERAISVVDESSTSGSAPTSVAAAGRSPSQLAPGRAMIGYVIDVGSTSDEEAAIKATSRRSGCELIEIVRDRENGRPLARPGLGYALERIANGIAHGLVVSDLHHLSHSFVDLGELMAWFREADATLIALDPGIDTSTPAGRAVASTLIALSRSERERPDDRAWTVGSSSRSTGQPAVTDRPDLVERIAAMRTSNMTMQAIADRLNAEGVPTLRGGTKWRPSSIQAALGYRRPSPRDHLAPVRKRERS
jgi:putative peptidoglycan binding protein/resolvase-like protein/recombinase